MKKYLAIGHFKESKKFNFYCNESYNKRKFCKEYVRQ